MIELETERLLLRQWKPSDIEEYAAICQDPKVMQYLGGKTFSRLEAWRHMAFLVGHWQLRGYGHWAVEEKKSKKLIGRVGYLYPEDYPGFEIGWTLSSKFWGRGYAYEAATIAMDYAFKNLGKKEVLSLISPKNYSSIKLSKKLGQSYIKNQNVMGFDVEVYSISREQWVEQKSK
ncbi:GNAT family N-acetyltransferase [Aquimarina agarivorans]|uniref:GNAT family N-acetyltransferase n=1 Tax=Aquimarina agarivorans TaxID=980584 RepID=UPI000309815B|nr:GNAT family N-acetyltransferase [Aquimarina agarivorans]